MGAIMRKSSLILIVIIPLLTACIQISIQEAGSKYVELRFQKNKAEIVVDETPEVIITKTTELLEPAVFVSATTKTPASKSPVPSPTETATIELVNVSSAVETTSSFGTLEPAPIFDVVSNVRCRSGPSILYNVLGYLNTGEQAQILGRNTSADWLFISILESEKKCWVSYIAFDKSLFVSTVIPVMTAAPPPTPTPFQKPIIVPAYPPPPTPYPMPDYPTIQPYP
jgi:hypothetical protein